jgi:hypothetical protein
VENVGKMQREMTLGIEIRRNRAPVLSLRTLAWLLRTSYVCPRLSIRGTQSSAKTVAFWMQSSSYSCGLIPGWTMLTSVFLANLGTWSRLGGRICVTMSATAYSCSGLTTVAPAASYALSGNSARSPAS